VYSPAWWLIGVSVVTLLTSFTLRETARADLAAVGTKYLAAVGTK